MSRSSPRLNSSSCTVESLEQENVWLVRKLKQYEEQLHEGEEANNNLFLENQQLKEARRVMNSRVSDLSEELESLKCTISSRRSERDSLQSMYEKLEADVQRYKIEQEQALLTADETKSELEQAQEMVVRTSDQISDLEEYIGKLKRQIKTSQEESDKMQNDSIQISMEKDGEISELRCRISALETVNGELAQQVSEGDRADQILELSQLDDSEPRHSSPFDENPSNNLENMSLIIRKKDSEINDMKLRLESISLEREIAICKHEGRISDLENELEQAYLSLSHMGQSDSSAASSTDSYHSPMTSLDNQVICHTAEVSVQTITEKSEPVTERSEAACMTEMLMRTTATQSEITLVDNISCQTDAVYDERKETVDVQVQCEVDEIFNHVKLERDSGADGAGDGVDQLAVMSPDSLCELCKDLLDASEKSDLSSLSRNSSAFRTVETGKSVCLLLPSRYSSELHAAETVSIETQTDETDEKTTLEEEIIHQLTHINSKLSSASKAIGILDSKLGPQGDSQTGELVERYQKSYSPNTLLVPWNSEAIDSKNNNNTVGFVGESPSVCTYGSTNIAQSAVSQPEGQTTQQITTKSPVNAVLRSRTFWLVFSVIVVLVILCPSLYTSFKRSLVVKHAGIPPH